MSEKYKSPWQIEHEKMLNQKKEEILAEKRKARRQFLRGLKITRKSDPKLSLGFSEAKEVEREEVVEEVKQRVKKPRREKKAKKEKEVEAFDFENLKRAWPILVFLSFLFFGSVYVLSPLNRISSFDVKGNTIVASSDIASASELEMETSIYDIYKERRSIEEKVVNSSARIEKATVNIKFPNKVTIQIIEYQPIGYVEQKDKAYTILSNGSKLAESEIKKEEVQADSLVLKNFSDEQVKEFALGYSELSANIQTLMRNVRITPSQSTSDFITIEMSDGNQVKVPLSQMKHKLPYYTSIAEQIKAPMTIDMEIGIFADSTPNYNANFADDNPAGLSKSLSASKEEESKASASEEEEEEVEVIVLE